MKIIPATEKSCATIEFSEADELRITELQKKFFSNALLPQDEEEEREKLKDPAKQD
jgi:hypothetical protein